jgi:hypothetical protein
MRWTEYAVCMAEMYKAYITLVIEYQGKRTLGRPRGRQNNMKIGTKEE